MARVPDGVFLEPSSYRRRRFRDALRLFPVLAAWLFMVPLLWTITPAEDAEPIRLSAALTYIFAVWILLTLVSAILNALAAAKGLDPDAQAQETE